MTEKFLMARNIFRIFTENNPVMWDSKTFCIPEAKGLSGSMKLGPELESNALDRSTTTLHNMYISS